MPAPFEELDSAVVALDHAGAVGQGESGGDGIDVLAEEAGEGADRPQVAASACRIHSPSRWPRR